MSTIDPSREPLRARRLERIRLLSRIMEWACLLVSVVLGGAMISYWASTPAVTVLGHAKLAMPVSGEVGLAVRALGFAISMVPIGALIYGLVSARRCFRAFADGRIFSLDAVLGLRTFSICVGLAALVKPITSAALSLLLSATNGLGGRAFAFEIGSDTIVSLIFAGTATVITWVLAEATIIADENAQFV